MLRKHGHKHIYVPNPTWGNHIPIMQNSGLEVRKYSYYDVATSDLAFDQMTKEISEMPEGSCILLHACAHNPTGMDPTLEQWKQISDLCKKHKLLPFFDCAYQGFASGNAPQDAAALRLFVEDGHTLALVQSFSKNFGLYGQRVGALSVVAANPDEAKRVESQMKLVIRPMVSLSIHCALLGNPFFPLRPPKRESLHWIGYYLSFPMPLDDALTHIFCFVSFAPFPTSTRILLVTALAS